MIETYKIGFDGWHGTRPGKIVMLRAIRAIYEGGELRPLERELVNAVFRSGDGSENFAGEPRDFIKQRGDGFTDEPIEIRRVVGNSLFDRLPGRIDRLHGLDVAARRWRGW